MNQDEDTTIQKLAPGTWHGRVIRHEHNEVPGQIILIEDREYFFPENNPSIFFNKLKKIVINCMFPIIKLFDVISLIRSNIFYIE